MVREARLGREGMAVVGIEIPVFVVGNGNSVVDASVRVVGGTLGVEVEGLISDVSDRGSMGRGSS